MFRVIRGLRGAAWGLRRADQSFRSLLRLYMALRELAMQKLVMQKLVMQKLVMQKLVMQKLVMQKFD